MSNQPKYTACIEHEENITYFGQGDTPEQAFAKFMADGFDDEVSNMDSPTDCFVVRIYTTVWPDKSGKFPEEYNEEYGDDYAWYLGDLVRIMPVATKRGQQCE